MFLLETAGVLYGRAPESYLRISVSSTPAASPLKLTLPEVSQTGSIRLVAVQSLLLS